MVGTKSLIHPKGLLSKSFVRNKQNHDGVDINVVNNTLTSKYKKGKYPIYSRYSVETEQVLI